MTQHLTRPQHFKETMVNFTLTIRHNGSQLHAIAVNSIEDLRFAIDVAKRHAKILSRGSDCHFANFVLTLCDDSRGTVIGVVTDDANGPVFHPLSPMTHSAVSA